MYLNPINPHNARQDMSMCEICERSEEESGVQIIPFNIHPAETGDWNPHDHPYGIYGSIMCTDCCLCLHGYPAYEGWTPDDGGKPLSVDTDGWYSETRLDVTRELWFPKGIGFDAAS